MIATKLDKRTLEVLASLEWDGEAAKLTCGQLSRPDYVKINKVLETLGGKWNRKAKAHLFDADARDAVEAVIEAGEFVDSKKLYQFFETPDDLADEVVRLAEIKGSRPRILEPSAGTGQLIRAVRRAGIHGYCQAVEINPYNAGKVRLMADVTYTEDFLAIEATGCAPFDYVLMNPPFQGQRDIDHVLHAWKFLKPGGRLVSIMSPGWTFRQNRKSVDFKAFVDSHLEAIVYNDPGAFKRSGTMVRTVTVVLDK